MKILSYILLSTMIAGCSWSPERLNPFDPQSPIYIEPPITNRAPSITRLIVNTNCVNFPTEDECGVTVSTRVSDPDNNLILDSVIATISGSDHLARYFGNLSYNPVDSTWIISRHGTELDSAAELYVGSLITVSASDDSGATAIDSVLFPQLFREYPRVNWPDDADECVCPDFRVFSWRRWTGEGTPSEMEIRFYFRNFDLVPSLTIHEPWPQDTFLYVDRQFEPADSNSLIFYGWRLFVIDQNGNSAGSKAGPFNYREDCTTNCGP